MSGGLRQIKSARLAELRERVARGNSGFVSFPLIRELLNDRDWHRRRVAVELDDIRRSGVTWKHVQAWSEQARKLGGRDMSMPEWADSAAEGSVQMRLRIQSTIRIAAAISGDSELDVLVAIREAGASVVESRVPKAEP